jgi:hypothetical protein
MFIDSIQFVSCCLFKHTNNEPCPIAFCERLCFEMTTDLDETRLQLLFLPVHVYVEDTIIVCIILLYDMNGE